MILVKLNLETNTKLAIYAVIKKRNIEMKKNRTDEPKEKNTNIKPEAIKSDMEAIAKLKQLDTFLGVAGLMHIFEHFILSLEVNFS